MARPLRRKDGSETIRKAAYLKPEKKEHEYLPAIIISTSASKSSPGSERGPCKKMFTSPTIGKIARRSSSGTMPVTGSFVASSRERIMKVSLSSSNCHFSE